MDSTAAPPSYTDPAGKVNTWKPLANLETVVLRATKGLESSGWLSGTPGQQGSRFCHSASGS